MDNELRVRDGAPVRPSRAGGRCASQVRPPGRQGHQAGKVTRQERQPGSRGQSGRRVLGAGCQAGKFARQARSVRPSCAGEVECLAGKAARQVWLLGR